jgi:phage terminase large subunit-like protein
MAKLTESDKALIRKAAEDDLYTFIKLVAPHRILGAVHEELCAWWQRQDAKDNQLVLLPRDHQKSALIAYRVAHYITKHPETTVLYVSATADLAEKQLKSIKDILTSDIYRYYWAEMVYENENKRERWAVDEISVDHPKRKLEGVRDATVKACGLTANMTGLHCNVAVMDDVVVPSNAYTETGRELVRATYSQLSSIQTTEAKEWVVGTRYHPKDLYCDLMEMTETFFEEEKDEDVELHVYEVFERQVETNGEFLWPKQRRKDGKTFGFDERELARKKAKYLDITQFYAQYYNNPNAVETQYMSKDNFQWYDREKIENVSGVWYIGDKMLNVYAAIDFAFTMNANSDYTALVIIGIDEDNYIYLLDIDRFKTNKISVMYEKVAASYKKWKFRKLRAEVVQAQGMIISQFKDFMRTQNILFTIEEYHPPRNMKKQERISAILEPRYSNRLMWHYKGGNCQVLEEELLMSNPEHDDVKDALASVVEIAKPPMASHKTWRRKNDNVVYSSRFGGVAS